MSWQQEHARLQWVGRGAYTYTFTQMYSVTCIPNRSDTPQDCSSSSSSSSANPIFFPDKKRNLDRNNKRSNLCHVEFATRSRRTIGGGGASYDRKHNIILWSLSLSHRRVVGLQNINWAYRQTGNRRTKRFSLI